MTQRLERFDLSGPPRLFFRLPAGEARVVAGEEGVIEVRLTGRESAIDRYLIEDRGGQVVVEPEGGRIGRWSRVDLEIRIGRGADLHGRLASGDLVATTGLGSLAVDSGSGDVEADSVSGNVRVKIASGDIEIGDVGGRFEVAAAAGDVRVRSVAGDVNAKTASGDIEIDEVAGSVVAHSASGDIEVRRFEGDSFSAKTLSGDVRLGVTRGRKFAVSFQSLSGEVRSDFPVASGGAGETSARLAAKTMSGDVTVRSAD